MAIWDKYNVIQENNQPIFEDWKKFYAGIRKKKTFIYLPVHSKKPVLGWDWTNLIQSYPSFKQFLNIFGQPGMGDYNFQFYFTTPDCLKLYDGEITKAYFINLRLNIEQKWRVYNSNRWSLRQRQPGAKTVVIKGHADEIDSTPKQPPSPRPSTPTAEPRDNRIPQGQHPTAPRQLSYADAYPR